MTKSVCYAFPIFFITLLFFEIKSYLYKYYFNLETNILIVIYKHIYSKMRTNIIFLVKIRKLLKTNVLIEMRFIEVVVKNFYFLAKNGLILVYKKVA